jgi:hypothetical protein
VAIVDIPGYVSQLKDHAVEHGLHIHDERHFVETYSLSQTWEVDLHPEDACNGPLDLHLSIAINPRTLLSFEDVMESLGEDQDPPDGYELPLTLTWSLPPVPEGTDLLGLMVDLSAVAGTEMPIEVSAVDAYPSVAEVPARRLGVTSRLKIPLGKIFLGEENLCPILDKCTEISNFLIAKSTEWLGAS